VRKVLDQLFRRTPGEPVPLTLYSRPGCHLCEVMKSEIGRARVARPFRIEEVNIDGDPELYTRYRHSIPVLAIGGHVAFKGRLSAAEFERKFERLAAEWQRGREDAVEGA
jgi:hypothetical protein